MPSALPARPSSLFVAVPFAAACALLLGGVLGGAACGTGGGDGADAGPTGPTPEFYGFADRKCLDFKATGSTTVYTVRIMKDEVTFAGKTTWRLSHFLNGTVARIEHFLVTPENDLQLLRLQKWPNPADRTTTYLWRLTDPVKLLEQFPREGDDYETVTTASFSVGSAAATTGDFQYIVEVSDQDDVTYGEAGETGTGYQLSATTVSAGNLLVDGYWFIKNVGFVRIDPDDTLPDSVAIPEMTLARIYEATGEGNDPLCNFL